MPKRGEGKRGRGTGEQDEGGNREQPPPSGEKEANTKKKNLNGDARGETGNDPKINGMITRCMGEKTGEGPSKKKKKKPNQWRLTQRSPRKTNPPHRTTEGEPLERKKGVRGPA